MSNIVYHPYRLFKLFILFLLFGYLFFEKSFAYLGKWPIFVSEIGFLIVVIALTTLLFRHYSVLFRYLRNTSFLLLVMFMLWQLFCTIPYIVTYGLDALRDATMWGYALFGIAILLLVEKKDIEKFISLYRSAIPFLLIWYLVIFILRRFTSLTPYLPGSSQPVTVISSGNVGAHLGGVGITLLLFSRRPDSRRASLMLYGTWALWMVDWVLHSATNRGAMFGAMLALSVVCLLVPRVRWDRPILIGLVAGLVLLASGFAIQIEGRQGYEISAQQLVLNVTSTFGEGHGKWEATKNWRLDWWRKIVDYTFHGEYFWRGKGYGINLAFDDDIIDSELWSEKRNANRHPHSAHFGILARSGVPGFMLWMALILFSIFRALKVILRRNTAGGLEDKRLLIWSLAYFGAFLVEATFELVIENPQGGIWFWCLLGLVLSETTRLGAEGKRDRTLPVPRFNAQSAKGHLDESTAGS